MGKKKKKAQCLLSNLSHPSLENSALTFCYFWGWLILVPNSGKCPKIKEASSGSWTNLP